MNSIDTPITPPANSNTTVGKITNDTSGCFSISFSITSALSGRVESLGFALTI